MNLWKRALDEFFHIDWSDRLLHELFQSLPMLNPGVKLPQQADTVEEDLEAALTIPAGQSLAAESSLSWAGVVALPALALLVQRDSRRPRHPHLVVRMTSHGPGNPLFSEPLS
jgi:hypothetical protein